MGALWQSEPSRTEAPEIPPAETPQPKSPRQRRLWWRLIILILLVALVAIGFAAYDEFRTSELQSREFSKLAGTLTYSLEPGPSDAIIYPGDGPFDRRLGYSALGEFLPRLLKRDYLITEQVKFSPALMNYVDHGLFAPISRRSRPACRSPTAAATRCTSTTTHSTCTRTLPRSRR